MFHPGGVKVIEAYEEALKLSGGEMDRTRRVMRGIGNVSSSTILFGLDDLLNSGMKSGETTLLHALGPGFNSQNLLLQT